MKLKLKQLNKITNEIIKEAENINKTSQYKFKFNIGDKVWIKKGIDYCIKRGGFSFSVENKEINDTKLCDRFVEYEITKLIVDGENNGENGGIVIKYYLNTWGGSQEFVVNKVYVSLKEAIRKNRKKFAEAKKEFEVEIKEMKREKERELKIELKKLKNN